MDIKSKKWYDQMFLQVKELLEALVMQEAAPVGYFVIDVEGASCTVSWTNEVLTVTTGAYKWAMPVGWFINDSDLELITTESTVATPPAPAVPAAEAIEQIRENANRLAVTSGPRIAAVTADDDGSGDAYETVTHEDADEGPDNDSLLGQRPSRRPGVPSPSELLGQSPD